MKPILIGKNTSGEPMYLDSKLRQSTHMHVIGSSGRGKSKFLEQLIRQDLKAGHGLCLIDWHGTLYKDVLRYCADLDIGLPRWGSPDFRSVILLDPSQPDFITGFNPFMNPGPDVSTQVTRRIKATIRPWGITNTNDMPTFEFVARLLYTFMAETRQTLPNAADLLDPDQKSLRSYAIRTASENYIRQHWRRLQNIKSIKDWEDKVLSTENRLARFIGSKGVKRFMGLTHNNIDLMDIMDSGKILLVNLGPSDFLDEEAARVFASLFLYEFMHTALRRANRSATGEKPKHFVLYLDEFQEYITDDVAAMLEQVRKGGLHMVLAHQHLAQLVKDGNERLKDSIYTNCRIKAVFGGLPNKSAEELANEMFLPDLNSRQIKATYTHTIHLYDEEIRMQQTRASGRAHSEGANWAHATTTGTGSSTTRGSSSGSSDGYSSGSSHGSASSTGETIPDWSNQGFHTTSESVSRMDVDSYSDSSFSSDSESESQSESSFKSQSMGRSRARSSFQSCGETVVPFLKPKAVKEQLPDVEWTLEEKRSRVAEMIINQPQRHCFVKLDTGTTVAMIVQDVKDPGLSETSLLEYQRDVYKKQGALPASEVDRLLEESHQNFLASATQTIDISPEDESTGLLAESAPQRRNRAPEEIPPLWTGWRTGSRQPAAATDTDQPSPAKQPSSRRRRPGPTQDLENQLKVVEITSRFGEAWDTENNLFEVCQALEDAGVPVPPKWWSRKEVKAQTWKTALRNNPKAVKTAIRDRIKAVRRAKAAETA